MRLFAAIALLTFCPLICLAATHGSEGRMEEKASPATDRVSRYASGRADAIDPAKAQQLKSGRLHASPEKKTLLGQRTLRAPNVAMAEKAGYFDIYDVSSTLQLDRDGDAYHSEFRIRFDADVTIGDALVYAKLYIRRVGDTDWQLYRTTDDFWIYGQSDTDDYYVDTSLDDGFATGAYDILIDLYESGYAGVVATIGPFDDASLRDLPLEESGLDAAFGLDGFYINAVSTTLLIDSDFDGYYSTFRVTFDPDTDFGSSMAYAVVWVRTRVGEWIEEHVSDDFLIDASGAADTYSFTADWISGYPTGDYDIQIDLHDASSGLLIASAGSERPELARVPLEDQSRDRFVNGPPAGGGNTSTSSYERGGGGALSAWWIVGLMGLLVIARALRLQTRRKALLSTAQQRSGPSRRPNRRG